MTPRWQPNVLAPVAPAGRYLTLDLVPGHEPRSGLDRLRAIADERTTVGIGEPLALALGAPVPGLRGFAGLSGPGVAFPSTQGALWLALAGDEPGALHDRARALRSALGDAFVAREDVACFRYRDGRDLTGYVDGTANPAGDAEVAAAIAPGGGGFVAVQRYLHDLDGFARLAPDARDHVIGRRLADNEELADAPASAHVKRTAQEEVAFMVRRSMPWSDGGASGLYFVAYVAALDAFERALRRMAGLDDGVPDALLAHTRAITGGYYYCPPPGT